MQYKKSVLSLNVESGQIDCDWKFIEKISILNFNHRIQQNPS